MTRTKSTYLALLAVLLSPTAAIAGPILVTTDFIDDGTRTNFNGFEAIPNDGTFYTGDAGPYVEGGISVEQINDDLGNDIWVNCSCGTFEGSHSWYANGGDNGYTEITLAGGGEFLDFGLYGGTGNGTVDFLFDLLLNNVSVLSGSTTGATLAGDFQYIGFSGGGFDTVRLRDTTGGSYDFYDGSFQAMALDGIEARVAVPEPGTLALFGIGLLGLGWARRRNV
jgi:hypothetical protein